MRALLGSLLLGLAVRGWFTRVRVLPDGQVVFEEIPAELAVIPNLADRNMYLQLIRGLPPPSQQALPAQRSRLSKGWLWLEPGSLLAHTSTSAACGCPWVAVQPGLSVSAAGWRGVCRGRW
ncbi:hypothetical protein V8C86DRAFT_2850415 [Haematococcus lacustris]